MWLLTHLRGVGNWEVPHLRGVMKGVEMIEDDLNYQGIVIRPPSEADSLILQITLGCSDNNCIFCPAYKDKKFQIKNISQIEKEVKKASELYPHTRRIFYADGDAVIIEQEELLRILDMTVENFPELSRIGVYGSIKSLENKSVLQLKKLKQKKLGIIYLGIETGDPEVYGLIRKYGSPEKNIETCIKVKDAGIKLNTTVVLGLGGKQFSVPHAVNTAKVLNQAQPDQVAALTLMIVEGTVIYNIARKGEFIALDKYEMLQELSMLIKNMDNFRCQFFSNHASNYFPIRARFPRDKESILAELDSIIKHKKDNYLTPDQLRGL